VIDISLVDTMRSMELMPTVVASIVLGIALAASCGLRAFLPLFLVGVLARWTDLVDVGEHFEWLASGGAILAFGVGVLFELAADKIPALNHLLDLIQTPVRTLAGMIICAAVAVHIPPWALAILAIIVGGGTALAVHTAKSALRVGGNATTAGAANPLLSILEDVACVATTLLSIVLWVVALFVAAVGLVVLWVSASAILKRRRR
jgi:hypothetical protein